MCNHKRKLIILLYCACLFFYVLLSAQSAESATYYVSPDGNDSNAGTIDAPWLNPLKAWTMAMAGDTVYFRGGTYVITSQIWTKNFGYNGTQSNPIVFKNYPDEVVTFSSSVSPVFRIEKGHNHISGINFTGAAATWFHVSYDVAAPGFQLSDCTATLGTGGDNTGLVYFGGGGTDALVQRCKITGPGLRTQGIHGNTAGIILFRNTNVKLLNNEISNVPIGIYYKHANANVPSNIEIAHNYIYNTDRHSIFLNTNYAYVHDNVIAQSNGGFSVNEANGVTGGNNNIIEHNTVLSGFSINCDDSLGLNNTVVNNLFLNSAEYHRYCAAPHNSSLNYNLYSYGNSINENRTAYNLSSWRIYYQGLVGHNTDESFSVAGTPTLAGGANPSTIAGFALTSNSIGYHAGSDGKDMGANVSLVGVNTGQVSDVTAPSAPSGLVVQ